MYDKKNLREKNRQIRAQLFQSGEIVNVSKRIIEQIIKQDYFINSKHILIFHPKQGEIDLLGLLDFKDKKFYLPRCTNDKNCDMEICRYEEGHELVCSKFGIGEPMTQAIEDLSILDVIFIPALGADMSGNRIGHGKGYYDRFFDKNGQIKAKKVVVLPNSLICEKIDCDVFDVKYDAIVTG